MKVSIIEKETGRCVDSFNQTFQFAGSIDSAEMTKQITEGAVRDAVNYGLISKDEMDRYEVRIDTSVSGQAAA
ncbi:MAG: hypothetical protein QHC90_28050 [Shinella sp.]|nr:hypothetical protein [Shinella sp.]